MDCDHLVPRESLFWNNRNSFSRLQFAQPLWSIAAYIMTITSNQDSSVALATKWAASVLPPKTDESTVKVGVHRIYSLPDQSSSDPSCCRSLMQQTQAERRYRSSCQILNSLPALCSTKNPRLPLPNTASSRTRGRQLRLVCLVMRGDR